MVTSVRAMVTVRDLCRLKEKWRREGVFGWSLRGSLAGSWIWGEVVKRGRCMSNSVFSFLGGRW